METIQINDFLPALNDKKKHLHAKFKDYNKNAMLGIQRGITFSQDDYQIFKDFCNKINLYRWYGDSLSAFRLSCEFNKYIRKHYNDHRPQKLLKDKIEGWTSDISTNKITTNGIVGIILFLSLQSDRSFIYSSMGRSTQPEAIGQKTLLDEELRVSVLTDGGLTGHGSLWNHVANLGYGGKTDKYYEFGIHDLPEDLPNKKSRMLARSVLPNGLDHTQNDTFVTTSHTSIFIVK